MSKSSVLVLDATPFDTDVGVRTKSDARARLYSGSMEYDVGSKHASTWERQVGTHSLGPAKTCKPSGR